MSGKGVENVVVVCREDETVVWPKSELVTCSEYFRALLFGYFKENNSKSINLTDIAANTLKSLLTFYRDEYRRRREHDEPNFCRIPFEGGADARDTMQVADMLGMHTALEECENYFIQTIEIYDQHDLYRMAEHYSRISIMREIARKWHIRFSSEMPQVDCACAYGDSVACLTCHSRGYKSRQTLYLIGGYCREHLPDCASIDWTEFIKELNCDGDLTTENAEDCKVSRGSPQPNYQYYSRKAEFPGPQNEESRVVALDTDIYTTGGLAAQAMAIDEVWKYDTRRNDWSRVSGMRRARFYHCIAAIGEHIYVCGGYDDNFVVNTLERYHPIFNEWIDLQSMLKGMVLTCGSCSRSVCEPRKFRGSRSQTILGVGNAAYANDESNIYVCCGQYGYKDIHTTDLVQAYNVCTDQWSVLTSYTSPVFSPQSEYGLSAAIVTEDLIVFGGQTERCDAFNMRSKQWRRIADMKFRRMETARVVYGKKLYSAGGYDYRTGDYHATVEVYDATENEWMIVGRQLPRPARSMGMCYVFDVERNLKEKASPFSCLSQAS